MRDLTENEIKTCLKMDKDKLYNMVYAMPYEEFQSYYYKFAELVRIKHEPLYGYERLNRDAEELNAKVVYPKEIRQKFINMENELKKYRHVFNVIELAIRNKRSCCKHEWELYGCRGYMREIDVYRCKLCGEEKEE